MLVDANEIIELNTSFSIESIKAFATMAGDLNPMHLNDAFAASTRFGQIIASGTQISSVFAGVLATHFSKDFHGQARAMLGLELKFQFLKPVFAKEELRMRWQIINIVHNQKLMGEIVELEGSVFNNKAETLLGASGKILVVAKL